LESEKSEFGNLANFGVDSTTTKIFPYVLDTYPPPSSYSTAPFGGGAPNSHPQPVPVFRQPLFIEDTRNSLPTMRTTSFSNSADGFTPGGGMDKETRRVEVDKAFDNLLKKLRRNKPGAAVSSSQPYLVPSSSSNPRHGHHHLQAHHYAHEYDHHGNNGHSLGDDNDEDDEDDARARSSDEDANSDDIDDFSELDGLIDDNDDADVEDGVLNTRTVVNKRKYAPNGRNPRGYHKWAGRRVALLSTGQTGVVVKKGGGRIKVRLDGPAYEISSSEEKLHLIESTDPRAAVEEIFEAAKNVPQWHDLHIDGRVAMTKFGNATGKIVKMPDQKRALNGLGHVLVKLDSTGELKKSVLESLRMIPPEHPVIEYSDIQQKQLGRPTKANVARKAVAQPVMVLPPPSKTGKSGEEWRSKIKAPTGHDSPPQSPAAAPQRVRRTEDDDSSRKRRVENSAGAAGSAERRSTKKSKAVANTHGSPNRPVLTRGQKMCKSCSAIIGTASRVCNHCGAQCPKGALKKT
jgi:hypothetical protein